MKMTNGKLFSLGIQHVLAMYAGAVIVPLIVGGALKLSTEQLAYLVSIDLLTCGLATLLQVWNNRFFGIGLPVVLGCTFTAVGPMIAIGSQYGISAIYGSILVSGLAVVLLAGLFGKIIKLFPPVVTGSVVTIIGVTLIPVAIQDMAGGQGSKDFGSPDNLMLSFGVLAFIIIVYRLFTGFIRAVSILLGLIAGTVAASFMGKVDFGPVADASWFHMVKPFYFGPPTFHLSAILTMVLVAIVSMIESTGVFLALGKICGKNISPEQMTKGYRAEGLAVILGGMFNAFPYTTYSQNVGLVQLSGIRTKNVIYTAGGMLIVLGLVPKVATITTLIPTAVMGGAMVAMFGMVVASGIKMLSDVDFGKQENLLIIACSVGLGLGVTVEPDLFSKLPQAVRILTDNGIVAGSLTAIVLNLVFNAERKKVKVRNRNESTVGALTTK
ncbi:nucleobase:cation symporter-2 family protein [Fictibacillus terranigra]|uniref:Nucleobase:cation symporter-2 family protein n=1 Tax=Fictibacillus terranigra TaxID=3058424 RepID=A0ABT8E311_9BACL|nr:nucleobase:cation symporter-2 family protein [Fictibacillus sp. CENA-BCM004]MDN4072291.1 nucleobase:cation symporter-2 family protein [Fictibacillus sp. CENA-BCM004]